MNKLPLKIVCVCMAAMASYAQISNFVPPGRKGFYFANITAGTPKQVTASTINIDRIVIQAVPSATNGLVYICSAPIGTTPGSQCGTAGLLAGVLQAASTTVPGGTYSDQVVIPGSSINLATYWIDVGTTNTPVMVSVNVK